MPTSKDYAAAKTEEETAMRFLQAMRFHVERLGHFQAADLVASKGNVRYAINVKSGKRRPNGAQFLVTQRNLERLVTHYPGHVPALMFMTEGQFVAFFVLKRSEVTRPTKAHPHRHLGQTGCPGGSAESSARKETSSTPTPPL